MEIVKKINMPAAAFYKKIMDSVIFDVRKQTGKTLTPKQLNQFEYIKEFSKNSRAKIKVEKVVENEAYHYRTSTTKNDYRVHYTIVPIDDHSCEVHYFEQMDSFVTLQKMNDMVLGIVLSYFKKRQFKKMLQLMEDSY